MTYDAPTLLDRTLRRHLSVKLKFREKKGSTFDPYRHNDRRNLSVNQYSTHTPPEPSTNAQIILLDPSLRKNVHLRISSQLSLHRRRGVKAHPFPLVQFLRSEVDSLLIDPLSAQSFDYLSFPEEPSREPVRPPSQSKRQVSVYRGTTDGVVNIISLAPSVQRTFLGCQKVDIGNFPHIIGSSILSHFQSISPHPPLVW